MALPQTNAVLTKVERFGGTAGPSGGGYSEDYDAPATDPEGVPAGKGDDLWAGSVSVYFTERRRRVQGAEGSNVIVERSVLIDPARPRLSFRQDDTVTVIHDGTEKTGKIQAIEARAMAGVPGATRLTLEDG